MICCLYCRAVLLDKQWLHHKCVKYTTRLGGLLKKTTKHRDPDKKLRALT